MTVKERLRDLVLAVSPFGGPNADLVAATCRAGALGVLDLGEGDRLARAELARLAHEPVGEFGVRVDEHCRVGLDEVDDLCGPGRAGTVVFGWGMVHRVPEQAGRRRVLVEITSREEALRAAKLGAHGLIARGAEAGGRVGELGSFVLLQQLMSTKDLADVPVWLCGGIGTFTAPAAVVGGAVGVVLDAQLALLDECRLPAATAAAIRAMDGSETVVVSGSRVLRRKPANAAGQPLPIGQDGFLAARFAERYRTVGPAVRAIRTAILDEVGAAPEPARSRGRSVSLPPVPAGTVFGTELPVVQGPMTRVSDQAGLATDVALAGGLPFVALALATGEETRELLHAVRESVGARPWGVGVLGFVPDTVKRAQLDVVRQLKPTHAIIAGGRPAQAAALEAEGISTFLHVPSPRLLEQFLLDGARKFIFEGAECGGHIGPRDSFPLWEAQIQVLLDHLADTPGDPIAVVFAGGIHDARSAAMVHTLARPLVRAGVEVGVLMGTAYLCTTEAVDRGAIRPLFQRLVLGAEHTELLETAPGHQTRAISSPFIEHFRSVGERLRRQGVPEREVWDELEGLNLGRLRIASKGLSRTEDGLAEVDEAEQHEQGLFMAGQVAVLRDEVTSVPELHHAVTAEAEEFLLRRNEELRATLLVESDPAPSIPPGYDIAIVGMACHFPQAPDLATFWANSLAGRDAVTEVPAQRWDTGIYYASGRNDSSTVPSKWGGFLPRIPFDPLRYGIPPASLPSIEPIQLLALEAANQALADAGCVDDTFDRARTSVYFGAEAGSDLANALVLRTTLPGYLGHLPKELDERLPRITSDTFPGLLSNVIAGRIANRLDLGGTNHTVDAACASSLAAVDLGCRDLLTGRSDLVICGGADLHNGIHDYVMFSSLGALSTTGRSRPFDADANGIVLGEGVGCVVLKRLADAERDGDRIYAVIKGVGSSSDGKSLGLTAPRLEGQRLALDRAYRDAGVDPVDVGLIEAHGTGTVVGDRTELAALSETFGEAGMKPGSCALGSVKSQIGHTKCAAGLAGLIRTAMSVHTGVLPPTGNLDRPNPAWQADTSPFRFHTKASPWPVPPKQRLAGVSAFGFGGTNFHLVLQGHPSGSAAPHAAPIQPAELLLFGGDDRVQAEAAVTRLLELAIANESAGRPWRLRDLAATACALAESRTAPVRIAIVATDLEELVPLLRRALAGEHNPEAGLFQAEITEYEPRVAMLFPGQGSQRPGMLSELFVAFPRLHRFLAEGRDLAHILFPPTAFDRETARRQREASTETGNAQPTLGIVELAAHDLLTAAGVRPAAVAGHSYGELVGLCVVGAFGERDLIELSRARADAILSCVDDDPGSMLAVIATENETKKILSEAGLERNVAVANQNGPRQTVLSGPASAIDKAAQCLAAKGISVKRLDVACAFHSPLLRPGQQRFGAALARIAIRAPELPVWANRTAARYSGAAEDIRTELAAQLAEPVRFADQVEAMYADGVRVFVEAGPGRVLSGLVGDILGDRPHLTVPIEPDGRTGVRGFLEALARLAVAGVPIRTDWLFQGRSAVELSDRAVPDHPQWTVDGQLVRTADGNPVAGGMRPAQPITGGIMTESDPGRGNKRDSNELIDQFLELNREMLRTTREMLVTQREVLLAYFGSQPTNGQVTGASPESPRVVEPAPAPVLNTPPPPEPVGQRRGVAEVVAEVIGRRTGYPPEMIEPGLDLEADLSIDSIKRLEIASELVREVGGGVTLGEDEVEELSRARTTSAITAWIAARFSDGDAEGATAERFGGVAKAARYLWDTAEAPGAPGDLRKAVSGKTFVLLGDRCPLLDRLAGELTEHDAIVHVQENPHLDSTVDERIDGLVYFAPTPGRGESALPDAFQPIRAALLRGAHWVFAVRSGSEDDTASGGLAGLIRTVGMEFPEVLARLVELDLQGPVRPLTDELVLADRSPVVRIADGRRRVPVLRERPIHGGETNPATLGLNEESVVLLIGGARGITARVGSALAKATGCWLVLAGRTPAPDGPEDPVTAMATDPAALRAVLASQHGRSIAELERDAQRLLAQREIASTLEDIGGAARYRTVDARDARALAELIDNTLAEFGRLDGVVYGAGVLEDQLVAKTDPAAFLRVFQTKVDGAQALLDKLGELPEAPSFTVFFGSIAATLGSRGQAGYAAANDMLETMSARWARRTGRRALTVHWGPWAPTGEHPGMVSPELHRDYLRRGHSAIDPEHGVDCLLRELAWGDPSLTSVTYATPDWLAGS